MAFSGGHDHEQQILDLFRRHGALLEGHFLLSSGLHSNRYLQSALVLQYPETARELGQQLADRLREYEATVVVSAALGGLFVGHEVARALGVRSVFTERVEGKMSLRRGFSATKGERAIVVEDVITTGRSTRETIDAIEAAGGQVVAAAALIDRSGGKAELAMPVRTLVQLEVPSFSPEICPMCASGETLVKPGSRPST